MSRGLEIYFWTTQYLPIWMSSLSESYRRSYWPDKCPCLGTPPMVSQSKFLLLLWSGLGTSSRDGNPQEASKYAGENCIRPENGSSWRLDAFQVNFCGLLCRCLGCSWCSGGNAFEWKFKDGWRSLSSRHPSLCPQARRSHACPAVDPPTGQRGNG